MKMENYMSVRVADDNHKVIGLSHEHDNRNNSEETNYYIAIMGNVYGRCGFVEGSCIHTSAIKEWAENECRTYSGSVYQLGTKNPDYAKFEEAVERGIPVLENWSIGRLHEGVYIKGNIRGDNNKKFHKKVVAQDGAILTFYDGSKAFVDWIAINPFQEAYIINFGLKTEFVKGRMFCGVALEPDILNSDWSMAATEPPMDDFLAKTTGII